MQASFSPLLVICQGLNAHPDGRGVEWATRSRFGPDFCSDDSLLLGLDPIGSFILSVPDGN